MSSIAAENLKGRTLVVFGAGYVGGAVAVEAAVMGLHVVALTRNRARAESLRAAGVAEVVVNDLASHEWHGRIGAKADFVLDSVSSGGGGLEGYRRSYLEGMRSILAWAERTRQAGHLLYTGSTSVYPQGGGAEIDENAPTVAASLETRGGILRMTEERLGQWPGMRTILRLAGIYGPGRHHVLDALRGAPAEIAGVGEHRLNLIHREDIVSACRAVWERGEDGVFNIADGTPVTRAELVQWLADRLGVPMPRFTGLAATGRRRTTPDRVILNGKARARLGWAPRFPSFREGYDF